MPRATAITATALGPLRRAAPDLEHPACACFEAPGAAVGRGGEHLL